MIYESEIETQWAKAKLTKIEGGFLKGPIALNQIATASQLPGQALGVFLAIHHRSALTRSLTLTLPKGLLQQFGISRDAKARSLHLLEAATLIKVKRNKGRPAQITLLIGSPVKGYELAERSMR